MPDDLREKMAATVHEALFARVGSLLGQCWAYPTGGYVLPAELVAHCQRQIRTPYSELSEAEKESDRRVADEMIRVFNRG